MENKELLPQNDTSETPDSSASEFDILEADAQEMEGLGEALSGINQLTALGNRATKLKLIVGHGYHSGQYEILRQGEILTLEVQAAEAFLQHLIQEAEG